jgi:hypothetical protein
MNTNTKSLYHPGDLSYYTTWWLTPEPSISSALNNDVPTEKYRKKPVNICPLFFQKMNFFI